MTFFSDPPIESEIAEYSARLYKRMNDARHVPYMQATIRGEPTKANNCHENARLWVEENPGHTYLDGWLCIDGGDQSPRVIFLAHSVVRDTAGELFDVTPVFSLEPRPFLKAELSEDDFATVVYRQAETIGVGQLHYLKAR